MTVSTPGECVLAVDPGREKCGVAVVSTGGELVERAIPTCAELPALTADLLQRYRLRALLVGNRTGHAAVVALLRQAAPGVPIQLVDEHNSTLEARDLYFRHNPPRGWRRLLPRTLLPPPVPLDDYAALVLARRYLQQSP